METDTARSENLLTRGNEIKLDTLMIKIFSDKTEVFHKLKYLESSLSFNTGVDNYMAFQGNSQIGNSQQERTLTRWSQSPHVLTFPNSVDNDSAVLQQPHLGELIFSRRIITTLSIYIHRMQ